MPVGQLTDLSALDLSALQYIHGRLRISNCMVLDKPVSRFEGDLCQPTVPVKQFKHVTL